MQIAIRIIRIANVSNDLIKYHTILIDLKIVKFKKANNRRDTDRFSLK